jgi:TRAP-type C4-dicarboxylate transport system permease large subunit
VSAFTVASLVLGVMVIVYAAAKMARLSTELAMLLAAVGGSLAAGFGVPPRHIAEGAITYLDINLIFITATLFMNVLKDAGGVAFAVRGILNRFHGTRAVLMVLLTALLLLPGALTGAGSVTVLITGGMVAVVLQAMGVTRVRTAAIVFIIAGLSAAAPPVSLWAMITAAGVNMPYVGFFWPLLVPCVACALVTIFLLGWRGEKVDLVAALRELPEPPAGVSWTRVLVPFAVFFALMTMGRVWPHATPVLGLPLMFLAAAVTSYLLATVRLDIMDISRRTLKQLLPLLATLTAVGVLVQIMTLTGVRGLLAVTAVTLPVAVVFATLFIVLPLSEAVLMWGAAAVIGVPLVLLFNTIGLNPIVALAGMSLIWPLGDALPPTAIIGRLTADVVGVPDYGRFLRACAAPAVIIAVVGTLMVVYSARLSFLTGV